MLASSATFLQLDLVVGIANATLLERLLPTLIVGFATVLLESVLLYRFSIPQQLDPNNDNNETSCNSERPFVFRPALVLACLLTGVLLAARWGADAYGSNGAIGATAIAGFADVHAAVLGDATLSTGKSVAITTAIVKSVLALATNTVSQVVVAFVGGGRSFAIPFLLLIVFPTATVTATVLITL